MNALPVYNDSYIKIKVRTYDYKVYSNFGGLNMPKDGVQCESFTAISIDSLLGYEKILQAGIFRQLCLVTDYLDENLFDTVVD